MLNEKRRRDVDSGGGLPTDGYRRGINVERKTMHMLTREHTHFPQRSPPTIGVKIALQEHSLLGSTLSEHQIHNSLAWHMVVYVVGYTRNIGQVGGNQPDSDRSIIALDCRDIMHGAHTTRYKK